MKQAAFVVRTTARAFFAATLTQNGDLAFAETDAKNEIEKIEEVQQGVEW